MIKRFKSVYPFTLAVLIALAGCKEIPPVIDFNVKVDGLTDTSYLVSPAPAPVMKTIFVEDITGVRCNNCPKAADKIKEISTANPGKVVALGIYPSALTNFMAPYPGADTLNTLVADDIFSNVYDSPSAIPTGGVNRRLFNGETTVNISYNKWLGYADVVKAEESPVVLNASIKSYNPSTRKARVLVKVMFSKSHDLPLFLSVFLTESGIISKQTMPDGKVNDAYEHNHALRMALTPYNGTPLKINAQTNGMYEAGRVFEKEFEAELKTKWSKDHCAFVVLVNRFDSNSKEVLQAFEVELK